MLLTAAACANADTLKEYTIHAQGETTLGPGSLNGFMVVDQTAGLVDSLDFTATGLGPYASSFVQNLPGLKITNPVPGEIKVDFDGTYINAYLTDIVNLLGLHSVPDPFLGNISGTYKGAVNTTFLHQPIDARGEISLSAVPEPRLGWLVDGLLGAALVAFSRQRLVAVLRSR
jgi:hypothetical protein